MESSKPHVVCIPAPLQGHINPFLKLALLLNHRGFHVTFVHSEFNLQKLSNSKVLDSVNGFSSFQFGTFDDGLPPTCTRGLLDLPALATSLPIHGLKSFRDLIMRLNNSPNNSPVSFIISDASLSFTLEVAEEFDIPELLFYTHSACGVWGYLQFEELIKRGYFPLKDESYLGSGYLDTAVDWEPAMKGIRFKDLPTFIRTTNPDDIMFNYLMKTVQNSPRAKGIILNTFDDLEDEVLKTITAKFPPIYAIGPLDLLHKQELLGKETISVRSNLWKEDTECIEWLDKREPGSVVYVNYGSLAIMTNDQLTEFAWGLSNSKLYFLWVMRADHVNGKAKMISDDFMEEIRDRGLLSGWCLQEQVLRHPSVGCFLTHCGWNSTLESICGGVPMICWPFFADQQINCYYVRNKWGIGMEIDTDVKREKIEVMVRELMEGSNGKKMKEKAMQWKKKAENATKPGGTSFSDFNRLVKLLREEENAYNNTRDPCEREREN